MKKRQDFVLYLVTTIILTLAFVLLLGVGGCTSFKKTTGYEPNKVWRT